MIRNYIKIAWRNMMKSKVFSFINIVGLSAGLVCCMLIALYLKYETSYDAYQQNIDNLYQLETNFIVKGDKTHTMPNTPAPMAAAMKKDFAEISETARLLGLFTEDKTLIQYTPAAGEKKSFLEEKGYLADASFFRLFTYNFIEGTGTTALNDPYTVVLSEDIAAKFFGTAPALHKVIHINSNTNGEHDYIVTGVYKPVSRPSHIDARFFMTFKGGDMEKYMMKHSTDFASNNMYYSYLLLKPGASAANLEAKFPAFIRKYAGDDLKQKGFDKSQFLVLVKDIHLSDRMTTNVTPPASKTYLYILTSVAAFILLIACINFMNLSTARSSKRSSEVGIRKVLGAEKGSLVRQFLGESLITTLIAFLLAMALVALLLPVFNRVSGKDISFSLSGEWQMMLEFCLLASVAGLIAGSYPAFYLSSFNPVKVLKGKLTNSLAVVSIRKGLVVFQFIISIVLIVATVVISKQMHYLRTADLGFDKDQQIIIPLRSALSKSMYNSIKNELKSNSEVISVGASKYYPGIFNPSDDNLYKEGMTIKDAKRTRMNWVDGNFLQTLNLKLAAGRLFFSQSKADTANRMILNENAVKSVGYTSAQQAVGHKVFIDYQGKSYGFEIIGVVKDFHFEDLHLPVTPFGFQMVAKNDEFNYVMVHARSGNVARVLKTAQDIWRKNNTNEPFEYTFLDDQFQKNYEADTRLSGIVVYFNVVAILIACLGLFGLAAFSAEQRTKEIGVRKVLGASVTTIISLLSVDFLRLILLSAIIASPIAWWFMNKWLQNFAYHQTIDWTVFVYTTLIAITIGLVTIGSQAIKAAVANPVKSLRSE
jgi:putative ABC transport system permease protein